MKQFEEPIVEIATFAAEDIVTTSDPNDPNYEDYIGGIGGENELPRD